MALTNPAHDEPHRSPETAQTIDKVDQLSSMYVLGLAVVGAITVCVLHLLLG